MASEPNKKPFMKITWRANEGIFRNFKLRDSLPRMLADIVLVNCSVILAFLLWFAFYIIFIPSLDSRQLASSFRAFYLDSFLLMTVVIISTFFGFGFYTKAKRYENRYKMAVVLQAITAALLIYFFLEYFLFRAPLIPRGVATLIWAITLCTVGGSRLLKRWVAARFQLVPTDAGRAKRIQSVLVIGGAGYIGSILVRELLARNYRVRVLDNLTYGDEAIKQLQSNPSYEFLYGDFRNVESVVRACRGVDAVIHLGAIVGDPACALDPTATMEINFAATKMVVEICKGYGISRFLFASTCSVYGASDHLMDEQSPVKPLSLYAATKLDAEKVVLGARADDFHPTVLRLATAFGHSFRPRFDLVVNLLTIKALKEKKITIYNGTQWRPFIHVEDIARCFVVCMESPLEKVANVIFNAGSYQLNFTLGQIAEIIRKYVPEVEIEGVDNKDKRNYRISFDKIHTALGFTCQKTVDDGVLEIKDAYEKNLIGDYQEKRYNNCDYLMALSAQPDAAEEHPPIASSMEFIRKLSLQE